MAMRSTLPASDSSAFLGIPLEIRRLIYRLCVPQNLTFDCFGSLSNIYYQNRPKGWSDPPWRHRAFNIGKAPYTYFSSEPKDCASCARESVRTSSTDKESNGRIESASWLISRDDEGEYGPSGQGDYCYTCQRYRPGVPPSRRSALPGLLLVCRQITEEVETMLYGGNTFKIRVTGDGGSNLMSFSSDKRKKMRKIIIVLGPMRVSGPGSGVARMDPKLWDGVLGSLSMLGVIAEQPKRRSRHARIQENPEKALQGWAAYLTPVLKYLSQIVPGEARIVVDANGEEETARIVEKIMPGCCHFQRLRVADPIFKRGNFSLEPGP